MITFTASTANNVWKQAVKQLRAEAPEQESRDQVTKELLHVGFTLSDPRQRVVFGRPINPAFAIAEVIWILSGANDVSFLTFWNSRMKNYSDDTVSFHGAYGFRLGSHPTLAPTIQKDLYLINSYNEKRVDQLKRAMQALQAVPYSRQVVLQIWNSMTDLPDPQPRSKDIPCNLLSHLLLRNGKLEWLQVMRSNDLFWGTPYNFIQFTTIQEIMAGWLGADVGTYNHVSDSLHVYERHFEDLENIQVKPDPKEPINKADLRIDSYKAWEKVWEKLVLATYDFRTVQDAKEILAIKQKYGKKLPEGYQQLLAVLTAEVLRKRKYKKEAMELILEAGEFWAKSWIQWANLNTKS